MAMLVITRLAAEAFQAFALVIAMFALVACTSEKERLDVEAKRLCAIDGGIQIYETVVLPPEKFYKNGTPKVPSESDKSGFGYYSTYEYMNLRKDFERPTLIREVTRVIRTGDRKVIAQNIVYRRSGGSLLDGYFHPSGFHCPDGEGSEFYKLLFAKGVVK